MSTVIKVENVSKQYRLGVVGSKTLTGDVQRFWAKIRKQEDPFLKIGSENKLNSVDGEYVWALRDINFEVKQGEVLGIIGKNGAGKSTLLKLLSRVTAPTTGQIKIKGRVASLLEVGTGFHPELTGRENIFLNGAILGMINNEIKKKFDEIVDFSGVEKYIDTPVKRYSSGMYVRLAFAVAAHLDPDILIVDEVLAVGDAEFQKKCLGKMGEVARGGRTILFVSHNMEAISRLCPRALLLGEGKIFNEGNSNVVIDTYLGLYAETTTKVILPLDIKKVMCLRSVTIVNSKGDPSSRVSMGESFQVQVEYDVNENISGAHVICFFYTADGVNVFGSGDADCFPERLGKREIGSYRGKFIVPSFLLGEGTYSLTIALGIPYVHAFDRYELIINFQVFDDISTRRTWQHNRRPGILGLEIPWELEKIKMEF